MKKIPTLFIREHDNDDSWRGPRPCTDQVRPDCEWVLDGEGAATEKIDGSACLVRDGMLWKRHARKPTKAAKKAHEPGDDWLESHYNQAPPRWEPADDPAPRTGLWPGWVPINGDDPADQYHVEAFKEPLPDGTYELVGPKVQGNPYGLTEHQLWRHGARVIGEPLGPRTPLSIIQLLTEKEIEGIVFHHEDGLRMAKIKRSDFGLDWPVKR